MACDTRGLTTLRVIVLLYAFGLWGQQYSSSPLAPADVTTWLRDGGLATAAAQSLAIAGTTVSVLGCAVLVLLPSAKRFSGGLIGAAAVVCGWQVVLSLAEAHRGSHGLALVLGDHATRFAAPAGLAWLAWRVSSPPPNAVVPANGVALSDTSTPSLESRSRLVCGGVLRMLLVALAITFSAHGWIAFQQEQLATGLLSRSFSRWNGFVLSPQTVSMVLMTIAMCDWLAAGLLLVGVRRPPLCFMTAWGMMTALSRLSAYGVVAWDDAFLRAANGGLALSALFLIGPLSSPHPPPSHSP